MIGEKTSDLADIEESLKGGKGGGRRPVRRPLQRYRQEVTVAWIRETAEEEVRRGQTLNIF